MTGFPNARIESCILPKNSSSLWGGLGGATIRAGFGVGIVEVTRMEGCGEERMGELGEEESDLRFFL